MLKKMVLIDFFEIRIVKKYFSQLFQSGTILHRDMTKCFGFFG